MLFLRLSWVTWGVRCVWFSKKNGFSWKTCSVEKSKLNWFFPLFDLMEKYYAKQVKWRIIDFFFLRGKYF